MDIKDLLNNTEAYGLSHSRLEWNEKGEPFSSNFEDIYFPGAEGISASEHIFLRPNNIPDAWSSSRQFCIGEIGFGTGLNFFATANTWKRSRGRGGVLHFISCEAYPLRKEDIRKAVAAFDETRWILPSFLEQYPPAVKGFHRLSFPDQGIFLTLLFGDGLGCFRELNTTINAWYLDGFAPSKNHDLWSGEIFEQIARLSRDGTTFATFSAAGFVKRGLESQGFRVEKFQGFAQKRESLRGEFTSHPYKPQSIAESITIVGGGLSGTALAHQLAIRGVRTTILEREEKLASKASGNKSGVALPYFTASPNPMSRFYLNSFLFALRHFQSLHSLGLLDSWSRSGVLHLLSTDRLRKLFQQFPKLHLPEELVKQSYSSRHVNLTTEAECFFYDRGGFLHPPELCTANVSSFKELINVRTYHEVCSIGREESRWLISLDDKTSLTSETLVLANAHEAKRFAPTTWLPVSPVRGQISELTPSSLSKELNIVLCYDGYLLPESQGTHTIGSTFTHHDPEGEVRAEDNQSMLDQLDNWCPGLNLSTANIVNSRVGFRTSTFDRMPFVGSVPDIAKLTESNSEPPMLPSLFVLTGLGSRGLISSQLCAEIIASEILDEPCPLESSLTQSLAPARWISRCIRKRQTDLLFSCAKP